MGATNSTTRPQVLKTSQNGSLTGITEANPTTGKPVLTRYTRIPYAQPPTGQRRWRRPQALPKDHTFSLENGEPGDYTEFGHVCPQPVYQHGSVVLPNPRAAAPIVRVPDEDCLFLNIWVPCGDVPEGGWPVQIFIHGGWLQVGDAMQNHDYDPYHLMQDFPRIIITMTYRLNIFGFLSCAALSAESPAQPAGNYGFWDQRMAIEWTYANAPLFGGNPENISVGGLSAGAYSAIFQLYYDTYLPDAKDRIIKRMYLYSNAVGIQPKPICSEEAEEQFDEMCSRFNIDAALAPAEKLSKLRAVPSRDIVDQILTLKTHTFRAGTDGAFIPSNFLSSIHSGAFAALLKDHGVKVMLGEVENEEMLYRLVNPAFSYDSLILQLNNYYPSSVAESLLSSGLYDIPNKDAKKEEWRDCFAKIVADCQVHATIRGFASCLLSGGKGLPMDHVMRYQICWRAKSLDEWLDPKVGLCHAADVPIWWMSGTRAGYTKEDLKKVREWLEPQYRFLKGDHVQWGMSSEKQVRIFRNDGSIGIVDDENWETGLKVWEAMGKGSL